MKKNEMKRKEIKSWRSKESNEEKNKNRKEK